MSDGLLSSFALGFLGFASGTLMLLAARKLAGAVQEGRRKLEDELEPDEVDQLWEAIKSHDAKLEKLQGRSEQLALRLADINVEVLDKAEKVAARLKDRERKRATVREEVPDEDHDEIEDVHPDFILARMRAQQTFPDHRQLPLPIAETEGRAPAVGE